MAVWINCYTEFSAEHCKQKISEMKKKYPEILDGFWISEPIPMSSRVMDSIRESGIRPNSRFIMDLYYRDNNPALSCASNIFYEFFGEQNSIAINMDGERILRNIT